MVFFCSFLHYVYVMSYDAAVLVILQAFGKVTVTNISACYDQEHTDWWRLLCRQLEPTVVTCVLESSKFLLKVLVSHANFRVVVSTTCEIVFLHGPTSHPPFLFTHACTCMPCTCMSHARTYTHRHTHTHHMPAKHISYYSRTIPIVLSTLATHPYHEKKLKPCQNTSLSKWKWVAWMHYYIDAYCVYYLLYPEILLSKHHTSELNGRLGCVVCHYSICLYHGNINI